MGITVHEHLIIGESRNYSFADGGTIARLNSEFDAGPAGRLPELPKELKPI
jgi:hypothetical protein